jgi:hypothetical protein
MSHREPSATHPDVQRPGVFHTAVHGTISTEPAIRAAGILVVRVMTEEADRAVEL